MAVSIDAEKASDNIQYLFMIKTLSRLEIEENIFNLIKSISKPTVKIFNGEILKNFPLRSGIRQ